MAGLGLLADFLQGAVEAVDAPVPGGQGTVVHGGLQTGTGFFGRAEQGEVLHGRVEDDHGAARDVDDVIAGSHGVDFLAVTIGRQGGRIGACGGTAAQHQKGPKQGGGKDHGETFHVILLPGVPASDSPPGTTKAGRWRHC